MGERWRKIEAHAKPDRDYWLVVLESHSGHVVSFSVETLDLAMAISKTVELSAAEDTDEP